MNETIESTNKILDKLSRLMLDKLYHDVMVHGVGFCKTCGELRKRCECLEFTPNECDCK